MIRRLFIANAALTLPFALAGLIAPAILFGSFGLDLDVAGQLVARGYAATLLGYGIVFLTLRDVAKSSVQRALLIASAAFNLVEALVQAVAGAGGVTSSVVWLTVTIHLVVGALSVVAVQQTSPR